VRFSGEAAPGSVASVEITGATDDVMTGMVV
jgi:hypothetical protein